MIQEVVIGVAFVLALLYVGRMIYRSFKVKDAGCATGCGKCGVVTDVVNNSK